METQPETNKVKSEKSKLGKKSRAAGKRFELKLRASLEKEGFIVTKWANQVDIINNKLIQAKSKYNPFLKRVMNEGSGFPDFLCYRIKNGINNRDIIGAEAKLGKYLDAEEKKKVDWLIKNKIFDEIRVYYPGKKRGEIVYDEFN
jgi:hypothetical protein